MKKYFTKTKILNLPVKKITITLIIGLLFSLLFFYLQIYKKKKTQNQIKEFESIIFQLDNHQKNAFYNGEKFAKNTKNIYSTLMNLELAKKSIEKNNIITAKTKLKEALNIKKIPNDIKDIIYIRIARIYLNLNKTKKTFFFLKKIKNKNWYPIIENIKGDAFLKIGKIKEAKDSYNKSIQYSNIEFLNTITQYKINKLSN